MAQMSISHQLLREADSLTSLSANVSSLELDLAKTKAELEESQRQLLGSEALNHELAKKLNTAEQEIDVLKREKQAAERKLVQTQNELVAKIDGTKPGAAGEGGPLANFLNSLLYKNAGNNNPALPARPGEQPNNIPPVDKAVVRSYAAAELDTPTRNMK